MEDEERAKYVKKSLRCPDPVQSVFRSDSNFGSITETIDSMIENYIEEECNKPVLPVKGAEPFYPDVFRVRRVNNVFQLKLSFILLLEGDFKYWSSIFYIQRSHISGKYYKSDLRA